MKNKKLDIEVGVDQIRGVVMTSDEKKQILEKVLGSSGALGKPVRSPYLLYSFLSKLPKGRLTYALSMGFLVVVLGGGSVFASRGSLPGNIFYPLKVSIVEPVRGAFVFSPVAKIQYQSDLATERLIEAEILASDNKLDEVKEKRLSSLLENHTRNFSEAVEVFRRDQSDDEESDNSDDVVNDFQVRMNAHSRILDIINERENKDEGEIRGNLDIRISKTARDNAIKARETPKRKEERKPEKYKAKKSAVQSLIDSTAISLEDSKSGTSSPRKKRVIEDTNKTLDQASKFLKEADEEDKNGDQEKAYRGLLDSEISVREADLFLNLGLDLEQ